MRITKEINYCAFPEESAADDAGDLGWRISCGASRSPRRWVMFIAGTDIRDLIGISLIWLMLQAHVSTLNS
jgi:hypothetical protein